MTTDSEQLVIIGSGPAAWSAAIYAARAQLTPLVFEGEISLGRLPGGQLLTTTDVENFPGFPEGIGGPLLLEKMRQQAVRFGTRVVSETVTDVDFGPRPLRLSTNAGRSTEARAIIIATGARAKTLGLPNESRLALSGGGVSACAVCDGPLPVYRDARLAVVGGGDSAAEEALYLTKYAREVVVVHRGDRLRASRILADRLLSHSKIRVILNVQVVDVLGTDAVIGLALENTHTGARSTTDVTGVFVAIGHAPDTAFLRGHLDLDARGYVVVPTPWRTMTSVPGVFAGGDVMDRYFRQAITAAGTGAMAALEAERWLAHGPGRETTWD